MKITIAFVTGRKTPFFHWFCDSLCAQTTPEQRADLQVVFVDGHLWDQEYCAEFKGAELDINSKALHDVSRIEMLEAAVAGRFPFLHIPPKPSAFQGPFRQTTRDYFAAGANRNTAVIVAEHPYLVFCDDLAILGDQWFSQVLHAANDQYVVCGMYKKLKKMQVENGKLISFDPFEAGVDSRWSKGSDGGVVPWHGSGMFGCSFGVPLEAMLEVDGNDTAAITQGGEDYDLGIRLERAGWPIYLNKNMLSLESEEDHHIDSPLPRIRKLVPSERLPPGYTGDPHSDHVILYRVCHETDRVTPLIGENLRSARAHYQATGLISIPREPQFDWRDGAQLSSL